MFSSQQPHNNSNQSSTDDDDKSTFPCPLDLQAFRYEATEKQSIGLQHLKEIELHVQNCKNCNHPPLKDIIFENPRIETPDDPYFDTKLHYIKGRFSPLHKACFYGELESIKHIIERWKVDVNQAASYCPAYGEYLMIEKVTPLFIAATMGHLEVVRYLIEVAGADVSAKTSGKYRADEHRSWMLQKDGLTPLYGAVIWEHLDGKTIYGFDEKRENRRDIIRILLKAGAVPTVDDIRLSHNFPLWMRELMLVGIDGAAKVNYVDSIAALIDDYGLDLNHRTNDKGGNTILRFFTGRIKLNDNEKGLTEEEISAIIKLLLERGADPKSKNAMGFTPIMRSAYYLRFPVLNLLLDRDDIFRSEKVDALELVGAVILGDEHTSSVYQEEAYQYWRRSLQLRRDVDDGFGSIEKTQQILKSGRVKEWETREEMEHTIEHRSEHRIQSFLIGLRILSGISWDAVKSFFDQFPHLISPT